MDIHGKTLLNQKLAAGRRTEIPLNQISTGIYIINLQQQGKVISQKNQFILKLVKMKMINLENTLHILKDLCFGYFLLK